MVITLSLSLSKSIDAIRLINLTKSEIEVFSQISDMFTCSIILFYFYKKNLIVQCNSIISTKVKLGV